MRGGSGILARNNFAGRVGPSRIFAGQARGGPMRGRLARFAIPNHSNNKYNLMTLYFVLNRQLENGTLLVP